MLDAGLDTVRGVITEGIVRDEAAEGAEHWCAIGAERAGAQVQPLQVIVEQVAADRGRARRALRHSVVAIDKEAVASRVIDDVVIGNEQSVKRLRIAEDRLSAARDTSTIHHVLVDGDVRTTAVHPDRCRGIINKAVVLDLHVVVRADAGEDATARTGGTSREGETIDRDQAAEGDQELRRGGHGRNHDGFRGDTSARIHAKLRSLERHGFGDRHIFRVGGGCNDDSSARRHLSDGGLDRQLRVRR